MTTLRVYVDAPPDPHRDADWALFDVAGKLTRSGRGRPGEWPVADGREAVIAAADGRLVTLSLPPLPAARVHAAVLFALEDQLAGAPEESHIAPGVQAVDGATRVAIVSDAWMRTFSAASARCGIRWRRAILESDLARPPPGGWCWCSASIAQAGFVRTDRGTTIAVGPAHSDALPEELALALAGADARRPREVRVDVADATPSLRTRATTQAGVEFIAGTPWRWSAADSTAFASAIDLQTDLYGAISNRPRLDVVSRLRPAIVIAAAAIGIHVLATVGEWLSLQRQSSGIARELSTLAQNAVPNAAPGSAPATAIARRDSELRHRSGLVAGDDLLALLARAAPALTNLPAATIRSLRYADGHVVFELQKLDAPQITRTQQDLQRQGLVAIAAPTAAGVRLRVGLD